MDFKCNKCGLEYSIAGDLIRWPVRCEGCQGQLKPSPWPPDPWPTTIERAVSLLILNMSKEDGRRLKQMTRPELLTLHHEFGMFISNSFGLWEGNRELLESCGSPAMHPDRGSAVIIEAVWKELRGPK